jgi:hypothetical protein
MALFLVALGVTVGITCKPDDARVVPVLTQSKPRIASFGSWCSFEFNESHAVGWSANQSPQQWTRLFVPYVINADTSSVQITAYDASGSISEGGSRSRVIEGYAAFGVVYVGLEYWGPAPWKLYIGANKQNSESDSPCRNVVVFPGASPQK